MKLFQVVASAVLAASMPAPAVVPLRALLGLASDRVAMRLGSDAPYVATSGFAAVAGGTHIVGLSPYEIARTSGCGWSLDVDDAAPGAQTVLIFEDGVLKAAKRVGPLRATPMPMLSASTGSAFTAWMEQPQANPLVAASGELPLQRGVANVVAQLRNAPDDAQMRHRCVQPAAPRASVTRRSRGQADVAGELQGLALLPFAVQLPGLNAERVRAAREGPEALAQLSPGAAVPGRVSGFLNQHHGVYAEQGVGGYRILVFNLGAPPSRNLSRKNAYAFAGVRDEIVEWVSTPDGALNSVIAAGLCEGLDHRPTRRRRGCTEYGVFSP